MTVSYASRLGGSCDILLKEVNSREEAFAEMRRYTEINGIEHRYTTFLSDKNKDPFVVIMECWVGRGFRFFIRKQTKPCYEKFTDRMWFTKDELEGIKRYYDDLEERTKKGG